ncbi:MAG: threonine synthase [Sulfolobales archaeon]
MRERVVGLKCLRCGAEYPTSRMFEGCPKCKTDHIVSNLTVNYDYNIISNIVSKSLFRNRPRSMGVWRFRELLPIEEEKHMITLEEGNTPLIKAKNLSKVLGLNNLYLKDESRNPTWSYKDRLCAVAISKGLEFGARVATVSTTGNHGGATAAYAARANMDCVIFTLPTVSEIMLALMAVYGAKVVPVKTSEGRWVLMKRCVDELGWYPTGTYSQPMPTGNPYGVQGYKTIAYEIIEQLEFEVPDYVIVPTAYGEGLYGIWAGFNDYYKLGFIDKLPKMIAAETEMGPLANALKKNLDFVEKVPPKRSIALSIAATISSYQALKTLRDSGGFAQPVSDEEILEAMYVLAKQEGIFPEAASAASLAAAKRLVDEGRIERDAIVVLVITSSGLKDIRPLALRVPPAIEPRWEDFVLLMKEHYNYTLPSLTT